MTGSLRHCGSVSRWAFALLVLCQQAPLGALAFTDPAAPKARSPRRSARAAPTALRAVPALLKRAKKEALKTYVAQGVPDAVMQVYKNMMEQVNGADAEAVVPVPATVGPLQEALTRRKGTITIVAEFLRKLEFNPATAPEKMGDPTPAAAPPPASGSTDAISDAALPTVEAAATLTSLNLDPDVLSPMFRASGASGVAVLADERVGGCSYTDLDTFVAEQARAQQQVPGPLPVVNSDIIIDELQVARSKAAGAAAVLVPLALNGPEQTRRLLRCCRAADLECIVSVETTEEAQQAVDMGATMVMVVNVVGADNKVHVVSNLAIPEGVQVCTIAHIRANNDKQWLEVEEAWSLRDKGLNCVWIGDVLFKAGVDALETPGAVIKAMKSKSSLKWASPKVYTGKGEGAREYLGDILM